MPIYPLEHILFYMSYDYCSKYKTVTERRMTEGRITERRMTERRRTEVRKRPNVEWLNVERPNVEWLNVEYD